MSLSFGITIIDGLSGSDVTVPLLTQANLQRTGVGIRQNGTKFASYTYNTSDPAHPITVTVECTPVVKGRYAWSVTLGAYATATESITGAITYRFVSETRTLNLPADMTVEVADLRKLDDASYGLSFKTLNTKVPSTEVTADSLFQAVEVW